MSPERETGENHVVPADLILADKAVQQALGIKIKPEFKVGVKISIFNAAMRRLREAKGLTQEELSLKLEARGVSHGEQAAGQVERFQRYPNEKMAAAIADELGTTPEVLFPSWLEGWLKLQQKRKKERTIFLEESITPETLRLIQVRKQEDYYALPAPREQDPEKAITQELLEDEITKAISSLPDNQREVIEYRFLEDLTLEQTGQKTGRSPEAVRQMEARALKNLRHPIISRKLRDFLGE